MTCIDRAAVDGLIVIKIEVPLQGARLKQAELRHARTTPFTNHWLRSLRGECLDSSIHAIFPDIVAIRIEKPFAGRWTVNTDAIS